MKNSNRMTLFTLILLIAGVLFYSYVKDSKTKERNDTITDSFLAEEVTAQPEQNTLAQNIPETTMPEEIVSETTIPEVTVPETTIPEVTVPETTTQEKFEPMSASMENTLFIGDSRTVGIMEYAGLNEATFFCNAGMSVFNVCKERMSISGIGKVMLEELLLDYSYDKIYIMLGINELGYSMQRIVNKYQEFIDMIQKKQPQAKIWLQANLHVSKKRSESGDYINNAAINQLNMELSNFADNTTIFYLDANELFDDREGNLAEDKTADQVHLYAKYYMEWGNWICKETARYVKEG